MQLIGRQRRKESNSLRGSLRRLAVRDGEHPREALGQAAVAFDGQAPVPRRGGDRLAPKATERSVATSASNVTAGSSARPRAMSMEPSAAVLN
jgi:hypothetical protein